MEHNVHIVTEISLRLYKVIHAPMKNKSNARKTYKGGKKSKNDAVAAVSQ